MNILCSIHLYPPEHLCGAEFMLHGINKFMGGKGHTVKVLLHQANHYRIDSHYVYDEIDVFPPDQNNIMNLFRWSDAVITHLDYTSWTIHMAAIHRKPVFHLIHNTHVYQHIVDAEKRQHIIYNSRWAAEKLAYAHPSFILPPPCDWRVYKTGADPAKCDYITLVNLDHNKGGHILRAIAEAMPDRKFIGVTGSYSEPAKIGQYTQQPSNVEVWPKQQDIRKVYEKTRILIMPSQYESWGRTATEAMASGIPVICTSTPGLLENCGEAGYYIQDRSKVSEWVKAIKRLDDPKIYAQASKKAAKRAVELDPQTNLSDLERWMLDRKADYR
jgi:glycosyltransferase involved in cell wall biosynthesis